MVQNHKHTTYAEIFHQYPNCTYINIYIAWISVYILNKSFTYIHKAKLIFAEYKSNETKKFPWCMGIVQA